MEYNKVVWLVHACTNQMTLLHSDLDGVATPKYGISVFCLAVLVNKSDLMKSAPLGLAGGRE